MADINQPTLVLFERERKELEYIPPARSNQAFDIGQGMIVLSTLRDDPDDYKFDLRIQNNIVPVGNGAFILTGSSVDIDNPYANCVINRSAKLIVNQSIDMRNDSTMTNNGNIEFENNSVINLYDDSVLTIPSGSILTIKNNVHFNLFGNAKMDIFGTVNIQYSSVVSFFDINKNINVDTGATVNIVGLPTNRVASLTEFIVEMNNKFLPTGVSENRFLGNGFVTFICTNGNPKIPYEISTLVIDSGEIILGDFRLSVVGLPTTPTQNLQVLTELRVDKGATLYIAELYRGFNYISPCLFLSQIAANTDVPGFLNVYGTVIADGPNSSILLNKGGSITINESAKLIIQNGAKIITDFHSNILTINGTLVLDNENQLDGFISTDIKIGPNGKVVILNPNDGSDHIVFSTPVGISTSYLYELFSTRLNSVEYCIQNNDGIRIDMFYERYTDMSSWYGGMTLEKAIKEGLIKWNNDSYIEVDHDVIDWVNKDTGLLELSNLFYVFGETNKERLQSVVDRFTFAGVRVLKFKVIDGSDIKYLYLNMDVTNIVDALFDYDGRTYLVITDNDGDLYLRNSSHVMDVNDIISPEATKIPIIDNEAKFVI